MEAVDSAHCFVQLVLIDGDIAGEATLDQVRVAAARIVAKCAFRPSSGGIARDIGMPTLPSIPFR